LRGIVREELDRVVIFEQLSELLKMLGFDKMPKVIGEERRIEVSPSVRKNIEELIEIVGDYLPDDSETAIMMGNWYLKQKEYEKALKLYNWALKLDPNFVDAWNGIGIILVYLKRYDEAEECYKRALELDPKNITVNLNLSELYQIVGKLDEALKFAKKAIRLSKEFDDKAISRYLVITAYLLKGERRKAKHEIRNLIKYLKRIGDKFKPEEIEWDISLLLPTIDEKLLDEDRKIVHALVNILRGDWTNLKIFQPKNLGISPCIIMQSTKTRATIASRTGMALGTIQGSCLPFTTISSSTISTQFTVF